MSTNVAVYSYWDGVFSYFSDGSFSTAVMSENAQIAQKINPSSSAIPVVRMYVTARSMFLELGS